MHIVEGIHSWLNCNFGYSLGIEIWEYTMLYTQKESHENIRVTQKGNSRDYCRNIYFFSCKNSKYDSSDDFFGIDLVD